MTDILTFQRMCFALLAIALILGAGAPVAAADEAGDKAKPHKVQVITGLSSSRAARPSGQLRQRAAPRVSVLSSAPRLSGGPQARSVVATGDKACECPLAPAGTAAVSTQRPQNLQQNGVRLVNQTRSRPIY